MCYPRCNIVLKIVSRIAAPTKRSHALRESLRARISSDSLADIGGNFSFSRLRSRMALGSNLNTFDIRFSVMLPAGSPNSVASLLSQRNVLSRSPMRRN
jgi:hypothetical protein